ncbi:MAG TPA: hypothetical protein DFH97_00375, partial [Clostridiales bacterium]|nr:hypothetical protein [Clostridiales bacterium]
MKKLLCAILALTMLLSLAACAANNNGGASTETTAPTNLEGTVEELLNRIVEKQPVEFAGETTAIDLTDTSEEGTWRFESTTGLSDPSQLKEAAAFEPLMGSLAFSMVMVRVADAVEPQEIAQAMKEGINPRKWVCVEADDMKVAGCGDVVML